jgi:hypothetical protein
MKRHLLFIVLLLSVVLIACTTKCPPLTDEQKADFEKQTQELTNRMNNLAEKGDVANWSDLISSDNFLGWCGGGTIYQSKDVLIDTISAAFDRRKSLEIGQRKFEVTVLSEDIVLVDRVSVNQVEYKNGQSRRSNSVISYLFRKEATGWKVIHVHESGSLIP